MLCPTCNQEISFTGICPRCSHAQETSSSSTAGGDPFLKEAVPLSNWKRRLLIIFGLVMWAAVIFLAFVRAKVMGQGRSVSETQGFFVGVLIFPVLVGVVVTMLINRSRKSKMSPQQKNSWAAGIALIVSLLATLGAAQQRSKFRQTDTKEEIARLLAEASGKSPVSPDSDWWDDLMRDFFRSVIDRNKRYSQEIRELDTSAMKHLYSPESYSSKEGMQKTIDQVQAALQLDQKYGTARPLLQDLEIKLRNVHASQTQKDDFLKGVSGSAGVLLGSQDRLIDLEKKWADATVTLYQFTIDHRADYAIRGKKLIFKNDASRLEFAAKQSDAIAQRRAFLDEKAGLDRMRDNMMTEIGIASQDVKPAPPMPSQK